MTSNPTESLTLVTGATGMLGSHLAERLRARRQPVRAFVRRGSDTRFLETLGVELFEGNLDDPGSCERALVGVDRVYHAAAKVGDWGPWREFQAGCIDASRNLAEASIRRGVKRFLHISSTSAYGHPPDGGTPIDESHPLGVNVWFWDPYTRSKVESEMLLWRLSETRGLPLTVIRPSWLYGERDRTTTARLVTRLRGGGVPLIGKGDNPLSAVYVGVVADAAILAANDEGSVGEAYNITNQGFITQKDFLNLFADASGAPRVARRAPYRVVYAVAAVLEAHGRLTRRPSPPFVTRYATWLMGRSLEYSTVKARQRLGWTPSLSYKQSIERTVDWYLAHETSGGIPSLSDRYDRHAAPS